MNLMTSWTQKLSDMPLVAILRGLPPEQAIDVSTVLVEAGFKIIEVPIGYKPRNKLEGKKINFFDGIKALITIIKYRFVN